MSGQRRGRDAGGAALAAVERSLAAIDAAAGLHAFLAVDPAGARAAAADQDRRAGLRPPGDEGRRLHGWAVAVKDNLCTVDLPTTCASRLLEGYRSPYEATVVRRVKDAGAVVVGKTNLDEFAMGSSTESSAFGPTLNPHDPERVPGGSSGGSAAAVAAGLVHAALGSDTGGSVRQPAAFCGIVGVKPSYGRVSRYGLVAYASSLDQVGTFGRSVRDAARLLEVVSGGDELDATVSARPPLRLDAALADADAADAADGLVVGVPGEYLPESLHPGVRRRFEDAVRLLRGVGAEVREVSLPHTALALPAYYVLAPAEASSNLARFDGVRYGVRPSDAESTDAVYRETRSRGFGAEVKRRILLGTYTLSAGYRDRYYARAQRARSLVARDFEAVFAAGVDVVFTPTTPTPAFRLGERTGDPYAMYGSDAFTVAASLAGLPALSLPVGRSDGLPVGAQLVARRWDEAGLVRAAALLERAREAA